LHHDQARRLQPVNLEQSGSSVRGCPPRRPHPGPVRPGSCKAR
jgi:hypothetical protein